MQFFKRTRTRRRLARLLWHDALVRLPEMEKRDKRLADLFIRYRMQSANLSYPAVRIHANIQQLQRAIEDHAQALERRRGGGIARARRVHRATLAIEGLQKQLAKLLDHVTTPGIRQNGHLLTPIEWHSKMMERQAELGREPDAATFDAMVQVEIDAGSDKPPELHDAELTLLLGIGPVAVGGLGTQIDPSLEGIWNQGDHWKPNA